MGLRRGAALLLVFAVGVGCTSHRFQLAGRNRRDSADPGGFAGAGGGMPVAPVGSVPPAPASLPGAVVGAPAELAANPNPYYTGAGNRRRVTETPRPGPPGTRLEWAPAGPELAGLVVDASGRPAGAASLRALDMSQGGRVAAETASGPDGRFAFRNLQSGAQYEVVAIAAAAGRRMIGSTVATAPSGSALIQLRSDFGSPVSPLGYRIDGPAPRPAILPAGGVPGQVQVITPPLLWPPASSGAETPRTVVPVVPGAIPAPGSSAAPAAPAATPTPVAPLTPPEPPPPSATGAAPAPPAGTTAPNDADSGLAFAGTQLQPLEVLSLGGETRTLGELRGAWILLDFFGSWCGPCRRAIPELNQLHRRYRDSGLMVVGVACEHGARARALAQAQEAATALGIEYSVVVSPLDEPSPLRAAFGIDSYPTLVLLDRRGAVRFRGVGADAATLQKLDDVLRQATRRPPQ